MLSIITNLKQFDPLSIRIMCKYIQNNILQLAGI